MGGFLMQYERVSNSRQIRVDQYKKKSPTQQRVLDRGAFASAFAEALCSFLQVVTALQPRADGPMAGG